VVGSRLDLTRLAIVVSVSTVTITAKEATVEISGIA
jgi:hypothetical protein